MIARLRGTILDIHSSVLTIDVQGLGYAVSVPYEYRYQRSMNVDFHIYYYFNSELGPQLFGFQEHLEKEVFGLILSCSGCGPKIGLAVLGSMTADNFLQVIVVGDVKALNSVPGIGQKKAELLIMHLKDKVLKISRPLSTVEKNNYDKIIQLQAALEALHYKPNEIAATFDRLKREKTFEASFDELLRTSLSYLAKQIER